MATEMLTLRVSIEQKSTLETLANQQGCSVSDVIRRWILLLIIFAQVCYGVGDTTFLLFDCSIGGKCQDKSPMPKNVGE